MESYLAVFSGESPDAATIHAVMTLTEGNPFNLTQIAPLVHDRGAAALPTSVRSSIRTRVNALSADANWLLEVASVFGNAFDLDVLSRAAGLSRSQSASALDEATAARLLEWDGRSPRAEFSHQLLQGAIYERVAIGRRAVVHGQIARALEAVVPGDDLSSCSEKAYHFVQALPAGFGNEALEYSRRAARIAASAHAHEEAAQHLRNAVDAWALLANATEQTRLELMGELSSQEIAVGRRAEGWFYMEQTIEPALELGEVELAATTALGWMSEWAPASPRSDDILERILEALPPHSELRPQIRALLAVWRFFQDDPEYRRTADLAWREAQATRNAAITTKVFSLIGFYDQQGFAGEQLIRLGEDLGDSGYIGLGWRNVGRARLDRGDSTGASEAFSMAVTLADSVGAPLPRADARWRLAGIAVNQGNENGARKWMAEAATFEARRRRRRSSARRRRPRIRPRSQCLPDSRVGSLRQRGRGGGSRDPACFGDRAPPGDGGARRWRDAEGRACPLVPPCPPISGWTRILGAGIVRGCRARAGPGGHGCGGAARCRSEGQP